MATERVKFPYNPRKWARRFHASFARFKALVLHRRAGKTTSIILEHLRACTNETWEEQRLRALVAGLTNKQVTELLRGRWYGHILPTYKQAELVAWQMVKHYARTVPGVKFNESKLRVTFPPTPRNPTGCFFQLFGADKPDSLRGPAFSGLSFDEFGLHPPNIYSEVLSKSLADHLGWAVFAGTIKGKNQLYNYWKAGEGDPEWFTIWQDVNESIAQEDNVTSLMLRQAMEDDRKLILKGIMTQEEFDQEWFLSTEAAIRGAYWGAELRQAKKDGRITRVPFDEALPVDTDWDLGVGDRMSIWFSQSLRSGEVHLIDYYENSDQGLPHYIKILASKPYVYGTHWAPHDIKARELTTGKTRIETAEKLGIKFQTVPNIGLDEGIHAAKLFIPRCWFDDVKCEVGLEGLRHFRKTYNEKMQQYADVPVHDFSSHPSDAFRGLSVRHKTPVPPRKKPDVSRVPSSAHPTGTGWMA